jgi:predicted nucleic acid-binding protein
VAGPDLINYVLDTSVIIKWFSYANEAELEAAHRLRDLMVAGQCQATVPDLLLYELANALRHNPSFDRTDVTDALKAVIDLDLTVRPAEPEVLDRAIEIAGDFDLTVYDAYFVALAEAEGMSFVTADHRFFNKVKGLGYIRRLDDLR